MRKYNINSVYICPPYLYTVANLPWEIQKVIFQQYYSFILQIITLSQKNKLQLLYCSLYVYLLLFTASYCLRSPTLWSVLLSLWSVILFISQKTHNRFFSEPPSFGGMQHYLQSDVKVLHFTK